MAARAYHGPSFALEDKLGGTFRVGLAQRLAGLGESGMKDLWPVLDALARKVSRAFCFLIFIIRLLCQ